MSVKENRSRRKIIRNFRPGLREARDALSAGAQCAEDPRERSPDAINPTSISPVRNRLTSQIVKQVTSGVARLGVRAARTPIIRQEGRRKPADLARASPHFADRMFGNNSTLIIRASTECPAMIAGTVGGQVRRPASELGSPGSAVAGSKAVGGCQSERSRRCVSFDSMFGLEDKYVAALEFSVDFAAWRGSPPGALRLRDRQLPGGRVLSLKICYFRPIS